MQNIIVNITIHELTYLYSHVSYHKKIDTKSVKINWLIKKLIQYV